MKILRDYIYLFFLFILLSGFTSGCFVDDKEKKEVYVKGEAWTIMIYGDGDDFVLEPSLIYDIEEMKRGFVNNQGINVIVLADRIEGVTNDSTAFGEDFADTRLYRISHDKAERIGGGIQFQEITVSSSYEADMGDAAVLQKFIRFCKADYTAEKYALILWNHGTGVHKGTAYPSDIYKAVCTDATDGGRLYTAELTDVLTSEDSVDLIGFDACLMGAVEVAYQYRPGNGSFSADVMIASAPLEWGYGWKYDDILARLISGGGDNGENDATGGGYELYYDPASMTALELGRVIVEEQYDSCSARTDQSMTCYDLSFADDVKDAVDALAVSLYTNNEQALLEGIRGSYTGGANGLFYFDDSSLTSWKSIPMFDLYDLCNRIDASFDDGTETCAGAVKTAVDNMVVYSFAGSDFSGFTGGQNGLSIFFPDGSYIVHDSIIDQDVPVWAYMWWYNALDTNIYYAEGFLYGKLAWCIDNASESNGNIENWFELLDKWYDVPAAKSGKSWNVYDPD